MTETTYVAKYIKFVELPQTGKTRKWNIISLRNGDILGGVKWWGAWRGYVFIPASVVHPAYQVIFEQDCLRDIAKFLEDRTKDHKDLNKLNKNLSKGLAEDGQE